MIVKTPPMGWNSWNTFGSQINEEIVLGMADVMVSSGLRDAGYNYLVIDDCWALRDRGEHDELVPDPEKFPHGMKYVSDYVHAKGLKFGMYSCNGTMTCAGFPSSFDHEFQDAKQFADWGVDFLKYDNCYRPVNYSGRLLYKRMGLALATCGRDILFSACNWGQEDSQDWIKETGAHMWRSTGDINDSWASIKDLIKQQHKLFKTNGQGCFNDMDMLVVGMYGKGNVAFDSNVCGDTEYKTHFSAWALFGSPLMIGCDIRSMTEATKHILMNQELIAINQDAAYRQVFTLPTTPSDEMQWNTYFRYLENGDIAIGIFNTSDSDFCFAFAMEDIGLGGRSGKALQLRDLWTGKDLGTYKDYFHFPVIKPHDCLVMRGTIVDA